MQAMTFRRAYILVCLVLTAVLVAGLVFLDTSLIVVIALMWVVALFPARWAAQRMSRPPGRSHRGA